MRQVTRLWVMLFWLALLPASAQMAPIIPNCGDSGHALGYSRPRSFFCQAVSGSGIPRIDLQNNGTLYGSITSGQTGVLNFANCTVTGTAPSFTITCSSGGTTVSNIAKVSHMWLDSLTAPTFTQSQPACGDLSDSGSACQVTAPANTTATTHEVFDTYTASTGAFGKVQLACGDLSDSAGGCSAATQPYDISITYGQPNAGEWRLDAGVRTISFAANFSGSQGTCFTNPVGTVTFTIWSATFGTALTSATQLGTATVNTSCVFSFTSVGGTTKSYAAGAYLAVQAPLMQDPNMNGVAIKLAGTRTP
jgi:hypothetical protein